MLSKSTLKLLKLATKMIYYSGAYPVKWVKIGSKDRISLQEVKGYRIIVGLHFLNLLLYEVFMTYRVTHVLFFHHEEVSLSTIIQLLWNLVCYSMPILIQLNNLYKWEETPQLINAYLQLFEMFKETYVHKIHVEMKNGCEKLFRVIFTLGMLIALQNLILILRVPHRPYFFTSLLNDPKHQPFLYKLPLICLQAWVWSSCWAHCFFLGFNMFSYAYCSIFIIQQLRFEVKDPKTFMKVRQAKTIEKLYRSIQVLHKMFNFCFQMWLFPTHKSIVASAAVIGTYGAIKISGPRAIIMGVTATLALIYLSLMFWSMGKLFETSKETLHSWKYEKDRGMRKFLQAAPPIKVKIGQYYYVDKTTVIVIWATVFNFTTNMLLSF